MLRSRDCKVNDRLYDDLCHSSFLYEIQTEFRDYCVRKNIKEQSLFLMDPPSPQEPVSPSGPQLDPTAPSSCGTSISKKDYFPNLSLDERKIRILYNALIRNGFISPDTDYSVFHFRFSGKSKPVETSPVCWDKKKKELAYLIKRLTRKDIHDPDCKDATSNDVYSKTKKFFIVKVESGVLPIILVTWLLIWILRTKKWLMACWMSFLNAADCFLIPLFISAGWKEWPFLFFIGKRSSWCLRILSVDSLFPFDTAYPLSQYAQFWVYFCFYPLSIVRILFLSSCPNASIVSIGGYIGACKCLFSHTLTKNTIYDENIRSDQDSWNHWKAGCQKEHQIRFHRDRLNTGCCSSYLLCYYVRQISR